MGWQDTVYNSLQFFQWLVMLQCSGQNYGSSGSQTIVSEAVVRYNQTRTYLVRSTSSFDGSLSWILTGSYSIEAWLKKNWLTICCSICCAALWSSSQWCSLTLEASVASERSSTSSEKDIQETPFLCEQALRRAEAAERLFGKHSLGGYKSWKGDSVLNPETAGDIILLCKLANRLSLFVSTQVCCSSVLKRTKHWCRVPLPQISTLMT